MARAGNVNVYLSGLGTVTPLRQPRALLDLDPELRTVTYRAARGAYFAATIRTGLLASAKIAHGMPGV